MISDQGYLAAARHAHPPIRSMMADSHAIFHPSSALRCSLPKTDLIEP